MQDMRGIILKSASRDHRRHWGSTVVKVLSVFVSTCVERPPWMNIVVAFSSGFQRLRLFRFFRKRRLGQMLWKCFLIHPRGPGGVLGVPGGMSEGLLKGLGRSLGDLGTTFSAVGFRIDFLVDLGHQKDAQREAFGEAKGSQNRSQNDPQTTLNRRRF